MGKLQVWGMVALVCVTFTVGFVAGYKAKGVRLRYLERKRERLLQKLRTTQEQINVAQKL